MKHLVILGAGTAGTMVANRVSRSVPHDWSVSVVDPSPRHLYQPGLVALPFDGRGAEALERPRAATLSSRVHWIQEEVHAVDPTTRRITVGAGSPLRYDLLVLASGAVAGVDELARSLDGHWGQAVHEPYSLPGALSLRNALERFQEGRLVVSLPATPIKGPAAPLELLFLADELFTRRGRRTRVELVLTTPDAAVWPGPQAAHVLDGLLQRRGITVERSFVPAALEPGERTLRAADGRTLSWDLLIVIPPHRGAPFVTRSGLGDALGFVPTAPDTLRARGLDDVFVLGDATDLPVGKFGSVAYFQSRIVSESLLHTIQGRASETFDGHMSCFVESGRGRALLLDGGYGTETAPGPFPLPWLGPLRLLEENRLSHWTHQALEPLYWWALLPGHTLPIPRRTPRRQAPT
ncbi:MAG TPA: oxidoreductase [Acidobacteria bacterium]|nr:oxidoreductase [Acidobacteriota bacterium]